MHNEIQQALSPQVDVGATPHLMVGVCIAAQEKF
jgi:hypothetical protein